MNAVAREVFDHLRPMQESDVSAVMAIERAVYPHGWTAGIFRDCLRVGYCCWVMEDGEGLLGYGVMSVGGGEAHVLNIAIRPGAQGQGHGRRLLSHILDLAGHHGAEEAFLEVRPSNKGAIHLYEQVGFHQVGLRRDYYPDGKGREDALIMARRVGF